MKLLYLLECTLRLLVIWVLMKRVSSRLKRDPVAGACTFYFRCSMPAGLLFLIAGFVVHEVDRCLESAPSPVESVSSLLGVTLAPLLATSLLLWNVAAGAFLVNPLMSMLRRLFGVADRSAAFNRFWPGLILGSVELLAYPIAILIGRPEAIVLWLGIKTAGTWKEWQEGWRGRNRFNLFLIGNAAVIFLALVCALVIKEYAEVPPGPPRP